MGFLAKQQTKVSFFPQFIHSGEYLSSLPFIY